MLSNCDLVSNVSPLLIFCRYQMKCKSVSNVSPRYIIQAIEVTAEGIGRDASDLLRKIKAAQYVAAHPGEVCPAKWKEGEATLAPSLDLVGKI